LFLFDFVTCPCSFWTKRRDNLFVYDDDDDDDDDNPVRVQVHCICACWQCGFFERKQREQLIRKKRESMRLFEQEVNYDDDEVPGTSGNDVIDDGRGLCAERDSLPEKLSLYDNDDD